MGPFRAFTHDWDTYNNNEPFWGALHDLSLTNAAVKAGFARARVFETLADGAATVGGVATAVAVDPDKIVGSDRGGGKKFYFGAVK